VQRRGVGPRYPNAGTTRQKTHRERYKSISDPTTRDPASKRNQAGIETTTGEDPQPVK